MARKKADENVVKKIGPFDIIKYIFTDENEFNKLSNLTLERNFFMINRVFSIKYPMQAQCFNALNINMSEVIKCWKQFLVAKEGNKVPYFVYTKGSKKSTESEEAKKEIKKTSIIAYAKKYKLSLRDVDDLILFCFNQMLEETERVDKLESLKEQEKNIISQKIKK